MIQDIFPHRFDVAYCPVPPDRADFIALFQKGGLYLKDEDSFFTFSDLGFDPEPDDLLHMYRIDDRNYYLWLKEDIPEELASKAVVIEKGGFRLLPSNEIAFSVYTAKHLHDWYRANRFCGRCGSPASVGKDERKMICPGCGNMVYPRINPSVIVAVYDDHNRLLMTKYRGRDVTWYVLIAGFIEIGESAEDTVRREVMEEAGVRVTDIRYFASQPWGISGNLILGYTARLDGSDQITLDSQELSDAKWFSREEVPLHADNRSVTSALIRGFAEGRYGVS